MHQMQPHKSIGRDAVARDAASMHKTGILPASCLVVYRASNFLYIKLPFHLSQDYSATLNPSKPEVSNIRV